ncbi:shikimate dehydrogenase [Polynucleobacter sp. AP-Latsch-80-C2]|uniref:shikimate dehydrogenase n=1 Tax=Polynucleobacter sp. AP-Latsch-80-C2 TaxID=2576931 RepID=UPI001C0E22C8|nr:shikimate dehydrogenase [Polynucleobacter sp. AP-Latsch-80-C2]MBU3623305.1 shikimate dehydrogenase [Polynucleobacter sp. AP-Latsch-80-C2]
MTSPAPIDLHTDPKLFDGVDVYAVAGNPISHSKSPLIHARFAQQSKQAMHYGRLQPELGGFAKAAQEFFTAGGKGMNVTVPFKLDAQALADVLTPRAQLAGAVNTLWNRDGKVYGDNTDGAGLVRDLLAQGIALHGARILLVGAGGAARGVLGPLLDQSPKHLVLANRSSAKADELVALFAGLAKAKNTTLESATLESLEDAKRTTPFDLVINATAAGLDNQSPLSNTAAANIFVPSSFAYEMLYGKTTSFMQQALQRGSRVSDGLGMLVEQAADAFLLWRGADLATTIDPRVVLAELRS